MWSRNSSSGIDEVLVVSSASGLHPRFDLRVQRALGVGVLDDRLDHQVGIRRAVAGEVALEPRGHRRTFRLVLDLLREQILRARQRAVDEALLAIGQRHLEALVGRPRRDVAAHHAGADHVHALDAGSPCRPGP